MPATVPEEREEEEESPELVGVAVTVTTTVGIVGSEEGYNNHSCGKKRDWHGILDHRLCRFGETRRKGAVPGAVCVSHTDSVALYILKTSKLY